MPTFRTLILRYRRLLVIGLHLLLVVASSYIAFWLRFDGVVPAEQHTLFLQTLPWLLLIRGHVFAPFSLYEGLWRYTSIWELRNLVGGVISSTVLFYFFVTELFGEHGYPRSIFVIDSLVLICMLGGVRSIWRFHRQVQALKSDKKALICGSGDAGEMVVRDLKNYPALYDCQPIGLVDNELGELQQRIHGVPVLGTHDDIPKIMKTKMPDLVIIALSNSTPAILRTLVELLQPFKVPIKTVSISDVSGKSNGSRGQIRDLSLVDLLERAPVGLDLEPVRQSISGRPVMVTGAGGSIGAELCRQIAQYEPELLVLLETSERALYEIDVEIRSKFPKINCLPSLTDIRDMGAVDALMEKVAPEIVFHAAAYKHVPMMESHPSEAVLNNVCGTARLCEAAIRHAVRQFVLISTDKAANPTNVMGASKRLSELYVLARSKRSDSNTTTLSAVRFGNVLGSSGSVVPLFRQQIEKGGPVTITHPEVTRYFMTIPEAVELVLQASTLAQGGEIFVLEMGEQVKLLDLARNLIRLSGYIPGDEIPITFIGLRKGDKLHEELVGNNETMDATSVEKINSVHGCSLPDIVTLEQEISELERLALERKDDAVVRLLVKVVPNFRPPDSFQDRARPFSRWQAPATEPLFLRSNASPRVRGS